MSEPASDGGMDADILFPDREVQIGDRTVTVREFTYGETLRLSGRMRPLLQRIAEEFGEDPEGGDLETVIAEFADDWLELLALASGLERAEIEALPKADGAKLSLAVWTANMGFFCRLYWRRLATASRSVSEPSSPN